MRSVNVTSNVSTDDSFQTCLRTYVVNSPSTRYVIIGAVSCVINGVFLVVGVALNFLIILTLWRSSYLRNKLTYFITMVLSVTDFCVAAIVHPLFIVNSLNQMLGQPKCLYMILYQEAAITFSGMSFMTLFVINLERYLSIVHPLWHRASLTKDHCLFLAMLLWIIPLLLAVSYFIGLNIKVPVAVFSLTLCLATIYLYVMIFFKARSILNGPQTKRNCISGIANNTTLRRNLKLAKTFFFVVVTCFICYLPLTAVYTLWDGNFISLKTMLEMHLWTATLYTTNSTLNCLIIFWVNSVLRRECWKTAGSFVTIPITSSRD